MKTFLDDAEKHGVVFFSLGSQIPCSSVSSEKLQSLMEAFAEIPQRVLFKWETGEPSAKPDNVMLIKWAPQQDVLGKTHQDSSKCKCVYSKLIHLFKFYTFAFSYPFPI